MTNIMIIIDGMTDRPCAELNNKTPLTYADCRHMDFMRVNGASGVLEVCPKDFVVESLPCILTLLGVLPQNIPIGRAYFEALSAGIPVDEDDLILRCNLVRIENNILVSSCCEDLPEEAFKKYAQMSHQIIDADMKFYPMSSYKNLLIIKHAADQLKSLKTFAPHEHIGADFNSLYPANSEAAQKLSEFIHNSLEVLNADHTDAFFQYAYLPWGQSCRQVIPSFYDLHQLSSVSVCATEIVKGISLAMNMEVPSINGATSDTNTDLMSKCETVLQYIDQKDFILLHINGADEAAHRKDPKEKAAFIKQIDELILAPLLSKIPPDTKVLICSDHSTLSETGAHSADPQPFILYGKNQCSKGYLGAFNGIDAIKILFNS